MIMMMVVIVVVVLIIVYAPQYGRVTINKINKQKTAQ